MVACLMRRLHYNSQGSACTMNNSCLELACKLASPFIVGAQTVLAHPFGPRTCATVLGKARHCHIQNWPVFPKQCLDVLRLALRG